MEGQSRKKESLFKKIFASMAVAPSFCAAVLPFDVWSDVAWFLQDSTTAGISGYAHLCIDYKKIEPKLITFVILLWRIFILFLNCIADYTPVYLDPYHQWITLSFLGFLTASLYIALYRVNNLRNIKTCKINNTQAFYILIPIHDTWGLLQCILMPWHFGRYQSRAVVQADRCWYVSHGRFSCREGVSALDIGRLHPGAIFIPLDRTLKWYEESELKSMEGKKTKMGVRDCRMLMVAGHPRKFIK